MELSERDKVFLELRAMTDAWRNHLDGLLTEPLKLSELAGLYGLTTKKMATVLKRTPGVERIDRSTWRVPLRSMPPAYYVAAGLLPPESDARAA